MRRTRRVSVKMVRCTIMSVYGMSRMRKNDSCGDGRSSTVEWRGGRMN